MLGWLRPDSKKPGNVPANEKIMEISGPTNVKHGLHVAFDSKTGEFIGLPDDWSALLKNGGLRLAKSLTFP